MNYSNLLQKLGKQGFFDLASVVQVSEEPRQSIQTQLYRWCKKGKLISLRRGMYAIPEPYRSSAINPAELANHLYTPSYLSLHWALGYYGLIPEMVVSYTSISSRVTRSFENTYGSFSYRHIKNGAFFGARPVEIDAQKVRIAEPEKAMLDLWYMEQGPWSRFRLTEMRYQNMDRLDLNRIQNYAERFSSKRLLSIFDNWKRWCYAEEQGSIEL
jgi:predicted transcriptional regulator of viral defense system